MPTTRRSTASARGRPGLTNRQSTISFSNKVTKDIPHHRKKAVTSAAPAKAQVTEDLPPATQATEAETEDVSPEVAEPAAAAGARAEPSDLLFEEAQARAEKVTDEQIKSYWTAVEKRRRAPMVHQEGVELSEKILRHFDVSSQFGPCIGIPRSKRWQRAQRLGLDPPIEVLAVLEKEANKGHRATQVAHMDRIMNATALATS